MNEELLFDYDADSMHIIDDDSDFYDVEHPSDEETYGFDSEDGY